MKHKRPGFATAVLVLEDGTVLWGQGFGASGLHVGEICFTTGFAGYQETLTDPSFAGQIITFTTPHIGNVGCNNADIEAKIPNARGLVTRALPTLPSNWRATHTFEDWLEQKGVIGIAGIDTRALTKRIRDKGAPKGAIFFPKARDERDPARALDAAKEWSGLEGLDLAKDVTRQDLSSWQEAVFDLDRNSYEKIAPQDMQKHVVAIDYGAKLNICRHLIHAGFRVTVVPGTTDLDALMALSPDGVFLSNGPGDPAATGVYAVPVIQGILEAKIPVFGICLGHQLLALALGGSTRKMHLGHRGANHPVKDLDRGTVEITSQNHIFEVVSETLPANTEITHVSLFDNSNEGFRLTNGKAFSVQFHPEASPGPHDCHHLFKQFYDMVVEGV
jgi:carbamoyl-phosphate synthase small subunit